MNRPWLIETDEGSGWGVEAWVESRQAAEVWVEATNEAEWADRAAYFRSRGRKDYNPDPCIAYRLIELLANGEVNHHDVAASRPGSSGTTTDAPNGEA